MPSSGKPLFSAQRWMRYALAVAASLIAFFAARISHGSPSPFIPALAAVILSAAWAGPGPGLAATLLCAGWITLGLTQIGRSLNSALLSSSLFAAEGVLLCIGSARMLRFAREAAAGEAHQRRLLETASEGIWVQDGASIITYANARMAEMLGVAADRLMGRSVEDFYFPSDLSMERIRLESLGAGIKQQFDRRLRRSDGSEIWVLACCNAVDGEAPGSFSGSFSMMTDITERKRAEQALRRSEQRYRDLFEGVLEGLYQSTPDGHITAANPALLRMLGFARESELREVDFAKDLCLDPAHRRRLVEQLEREGSLRDVEYELRNANGEIIRVLENARAIRDEHGALTGFEGTLTDITAKRRVEEQLREAQKMEALGRLARGVAHDFNNVLSRISTHIESALEQLPPSHAAYSRAGQARQEAKNAEALTRQLLSFSRKPADPDRGDLTLDQDEPGLPQEGGETILLVEDDPLVRELSRDMLERQGYRVLLVSDASDAERLGSDFHFDLLIADTKMTPISGEELARRLRATHPGLRVLFVSGYDEPLRHESQPAVPGAGHISKPFSADSLGRRIRQILSQK